MRVRKHASNFRIFYHCLCWITWKTRTFFFIYFKRVNLNLFINRNKQFKILNRCRSNNAMRKRPSSGVSPQAATARPFYDWDLKHRYQLLMHCQQIKITTRFLDGKNYVRISLEEMHSVNILSYTIERDNNDSIYDEDDARATSNYDMGVILQLRNYCGEHWLHTYIKWHSILLYWVICGIFYFDKKTLVHILLIYHS